MPTIIDALVVTLGALAQVAEGLREAMVASLGETEVTEMATKFFIEEAIAERHRLRAARPD